VVAGGVVVGAVVVGVAVVTAGVVGVLVACCGAMDLLVPQAAISKNNDIFLTISLSVAVRVAPVSATIPSLCLFII
jgi:hypothetical protein